MQNVYTSFHFDSRVNFLLSTWFSCMQKNMYRYVVCRE